MIIGITGGSGSGKSALSALFAADGFLVIDCDTLVHRLYGESKYINAVCAAFPEVCAEYGIDRKKLAAIVFSCPTELERLNKTVLPLISDAVMAEAEKGRGHRGIILDAPTLFEAGLDKKCDLVIGVTADEDIRIARIAARDGISEAQAYARISSQKSDEFYRTHCDFTVCNNGARELCEVYSELRKKIGVH